MRYSYHDTSNEKITHASSHLQDNVFLHSIDDNFPQTLLALMEWRDCHGFVDRVVARHIKRVARELVLISSTGSSKETASNVLSSLMSLPNKECRRILLSPKLYNALVLGKNGKLQTLDVLIDAINGYSKNGIPCSDGVDRDFLGAHFDGRQNQYAGSIFLDLDSPLDFYERVWTYETQTYNESESSALSQKIVDSVNLIKELCDVTHSFVNTVVQVILLRSSARSGLNSSSMGGYIGRVLLINSHRANSLHELVSQIIHESIHSFLYMLEDVQPMIKTADYRQTMHTSPWTGNVIPLHSILHATFVWYGLFQFWKLPVPQYGVDTTFFLNGFKGMTLANIIKKYDACINPSYLEVLNRILERMRTEISSEKMHST